MNVVETLTRIKEVLMERGWYQGDYLDHDTGSVCILGAHNYVVFNDEETEDYPANMGDAFHALHDAVNKLNYPDIPDFNDRDERTFNDVIGLIDSTIISEKERLGL